MSAAMAVVGWVFGVSHGLPAAALQAGDIVVAEGSSISVLNVKTGHLRERVSGFVDLRGIAIAADQTVYVGDSVGALYRVTLPTRAVTVVSSGGSLDTPGSDGIRLLQNGEILLIDIGSQTLLQVDPETGSQTILTTFGIERGPPFSISNGLEIDVRGRALVTSGFTSDQVVALSLSSGGVEETWSGAYLRRPNALAIASDGGVIVGQGGSAGDIGAILRIDAVSGEETTITTDERLEIITSLEIAPDGDLWAINYSDYQDGYFTREILRIDPVTGSIRVVNSSGAEHTAALAIVPGGPQCTGNCDGAGCQTAGPATCQAVWLLLPAAILLWRRSMGISAA